MRSRWILPVALVAAGCGGNIDSHEQGIKAAEGLVDEMVVILKTVKDKKSAEAAKPKLEAIKKRMDDVHAQMDELGPMDAKLKAMATESMTASMEKLVIVVEGFPPDPEIRKALGDIDMGTWEMGR